MLDNLRVILTTVNTWIVAAGAFLAILVDELTPLVDLNPGVEWAIRVAGAAIVVLATAHRVIVRSTEVPAALRGVDPDVDFPTTWAAWNGGRFRYTPPTGLATGGVVDSGPPDIAA